MYIESLDHIQLAMPPGGEASARRFYGEILGLREVPKPVELAVRGGCWFEATGVGVHLGIEKDFRPATKAHPAFRVTDLEALRTRLEGAGVAVKPDSALPGVRRFYAEDPFGNRLEFIQAGDALPRS